MRCGGEQKPLRASRRPSDGSAKRLWRPCSRCGCPTPSGGASLMTPTSAYRRHRAASPIRPAPIAEGRGMAGVG